MARINLLPWREQRREERKKRFQLALLGVLLSAVALVVGADRYLNAALSAQQARNAFVREQIVLLDTRIAEIRDLRERRTQLLERMKIIQDLQGNRPIIARIFDQLVRTLPEGVYFTELKMSAQQIAIGGVAESNHQVSSLMRSLAASDWLMAPNLTEVRALSATAPEQGNVFQLTVQQTQPSAEQPSEKGVTP